MSSANSQKGRLIEEIAARLHQQSNVKVETRIKLPPKRGKGGKREIDVLLSTTIAGYPVRIAIECKNERKPIGAPYLDAFKGKLDYLDIPTLHGVFVSRSRYTEGAKEVANEFGIKLLNVTGIKDDGLDAVVSTALQSVVHLLLCVDEIDLENDIEEESYSIAFFDEGGHFCGTIFDPIWKMWDSGQIDHTLGERQINVILPQGWHQHDGQSKSEVFGMRAKVSVIALVFTIEGRTQAHSLVDASSRQLEKGEIRFTFEQNSKILNRHNFSSENELDDYVVSLAEMTTPILLVGRVPIPRIRAFGRFGITYWPPSKRTWQKVEQFVALHGEDSAFVTDDPFMLEGSGYEAMWEPIMENYPPPINYNTHNNKEKS